MALNGLGVDAMARGIYKYIDRRWVNSFLDGNVRVRSLSYYRQLEATHPLGDPLDGSLLLKPQAGLEITNHTQGWTRVIPDSSFRSTLQNLERILVFCTSLRLHPDLARRFGVNACVIIQDRAEFARRLRAALGAVVEAPSTFLALPIKYYDPTSKPGPKWAIPEMILTAKRRDLYGTEAEFRFACAPSNVFAFEGARYELVIGDAGKSAANEDPVNQVYDLELGNLRAICRPHVFVE